MKAMSSTETVSGQIKQFRKITPTLATFRVNGIACKAEHRGVPYVERWSKNADCVYIFQGAYQRSRFGREFVAMHGRPEALALPSANPKTDEDAEAMGKIRETPTQLEAATAPSTTATIPAEAPLGRSKNSSSTDGTAETETAHVEQELERTPFPSLEERLEPLIQQQMETFRKYYSSAELETKLNSGSPIAREAARRVLAGCTQAEEPVIAA